MLEYLYVNVILEITKINSVSTGGTLKLSIIFE